MTLDRFADIEEDSPRVRRMAWKKSPHTGKIAGFIGVETKRGNKAKVYTTLRSGYHYYENGEGYAISESILDYCEELRVSRIIVHEGTEHDCDVYEFKARDYYTGDHVPEDDLHGDREFDDPQRYAPLEDHLNHWPNYAAALFQQSFETACERIGTRTGRR